MPSPMTRMILVALFLAPTLTLAAPLRTNPEAELIEKQWGTVVDPDRDCIFRVDHNQLHVIIPGKPHIMSVEIGKTNGPRVVREVEGDFTVEVKVLGPIPSVARTEVEGRWPYYGAGLLVWQDEKNYIRFERARMHFPTMGWRCYPGFEQRRDGKVARGWKYDDGTLDETKPVNLRLVRKGDTITASFSQDDKDWRLLPSIQGDFSKKLRVGFHALQNSPSGFEAIFEGPKFTPAEAAKAR